MINLDKHENATGVTEVNPVIESAATSNEKQGLFTNPFSFRGRIRRMEFGLSYILYMVWYVVFTTAIEGGNETMSVLFLISLIPAYWFMLAQGAKRCHDRDNSGWYQIIPFYGLWMLFGDGDAYENSYGPDPKGRNILS